MTAPPRLRPDVDWFLVSLLRPALPGVTVVNLLDAQALKQLPVLTVRAVSAGSFPQTRNHRTRAAAGVDVQAWAADRRAASDLDDLALSVLVRAQEAGTSAAGAYLAALAVDSPGAELRTADQPAQLSRWAASYSLLVRPA